jgi:hypothetical protein
VRRWVSEPNLYQFQHFDVVSRSWARGLPSAGSTSPRVQQLHREMLDAFEQAVEAELVVQVPAVSPTRRYAVSPEPRHKPAQKRLAPKGRASRDGSLVAAAEEAAGSIGQPVPLWFMQFKRRFMERLERNHAPLLFLDGPFSFALICVYCQLFISP